MMEPSWLILSITGFQMFTSGIFVLYDAAISSNILSLNDDSTRYSNGEIWWWQVRDTDILIKKRIEECNRAVARKNMPILNSFLCVIQSWKLQMKIDTQNLIKDTIAYLVTHKDFFIFVASIGVCLLFIRKTVLGKNNKSEFLNDKPEIFRSQEKKDDVETIFTEKVEENIKEILGDWEKVKTGSSHAPSSDHQFTKATCHRSKERK